MTKKLMLKDIIEYLITKGLKSGTFNSLSELDAIRRHANMLDENKMDTSCPNDLEEFVNKMLKQGLFDNLKEVAICIQAINSCNEQIAKMNAKEPTGLVTQADSTSAQAPNVDEPDN